MSEEPNPDPTHPSASDLDRLQARRRFIRQAAVGTAVAAFGGLYFLSEDNSYAAEPRPDGKPRLPPGQRVLSSLKAMGGTPGSSLRKDFRLKVHGEVDNPFEIDFAGLVALGVVSKALDVHCVTGWSLLGGMYKGVPLKTLADRAKLKKTARHVIFESAHGYTANVPVREALRPEVLLAYELNGAPFRQRHGAPVRAIVPDLYFWKSAKWLTGIRFVKRDQPGYWEKRGYNNHGDPWLEERYA